MPPWLAERPGAATLWQVLAPGRLGGGMRGASEFAVPHRKSLGAFRIRASRQFERQLPFKLDSRASGDPDGPGIGARGLEIDPQNWGAARIPQILGHDHRIGEHAKWL